MFLCPEGNLIRLMTPFSWEDIDASGASSMNIKRLDAIRLLVGRPDVSLLTLNTPVHSMNGVIPLGMAAWLNIPEAVRVLLEASTDAVAVDGMDGHGATALMCEMLCNFFLTSHASTFRPTFRCCPRWWPRSGAAPGMFVNYQGGITGH